MNQVKGMPAMRIISVIIQITLFATIIMGCSKPSLKEKFNYAISGGSLQEVQDVLKHVPESENKAFINFGLYYASLSGKNTLVKYFIEQGSDINSKHAFGQTALFYAVLQGKMELIELLINNGADVNIADKDGFTPLTTAICRKNDILVKYLLKNCPDFSTSNSSKYTPLMFLIESKSPNTCEIARLLIEKKLDLDVQKEKNGNTALMLAVSINNPELVKLLLENGAKTDIKNKFNETAMDIARKDKSGEIIKLLNLGNENSDMPPK